MKIKLELETLFDCFLWVDGKKQDLRLLDLGIDSKGQSFFRAVLAAPIPATSQKLEIQLPNPGIQISVEVQPSPIEIGLNTLLLRPLKADPIQNDRLLEWLQSYVNHLPKSSRRK